MRTLCQNFDAFKVTTDTQFDQVFSFDGQDSMQSDKEAKWARKLVHPSLKEVKFLSYNYLYQSFHAMDMLLNSLNNRDSVR